MNSITEDAVMWVKFHKKEIIEKFCNLKDFPEDLVPVSVFMAGSPGAGKTEFAKSLLHIVEGKKIDIVYIDADEIRVMLPSYEGQKSHLFQKAVTVAVDKIHDHAIKYNQSFVLDGTFASKDNSFQNIQRSLKHNRPVHINYIYQDPLLSWKFAQLREKKDGRKITRDVFIKEFIAARNNVNEAKQIFGSKIMLNFIYKDVETQKHHPEFNINSVDTYLNKIFSLEELGNIIV